METPKTLTITDDSGFLAVINAVKYDSFVSENWDLPMVFSHFVDEMNNDNLIIWATGYENTWIVNFLDRPSKEVAFREFSKTIKVTDGKLFLTNYEDLTEAAQFADVRIPTKHNADLCIILDNGEYDLTIRQLFDPEDHKHGADDKINFEIIVRPDTNRQPKKVDKIFWWEK